jgi:hypothetical protein
MGESEGSVLVGEERRGREAHSVHEIPPEDLYP